MRVVGFVFLLVGIGLLVGAWFPTKSSLELRDVGEPVPGTITRYTTSHSDDGPSYAPVFRYEVNGQTYEHEQSVSSSSIPNVGETQTLLVDPSDPTNAKPDSFMGMWFLTALLGGMGALFFLIGFFSLLTGTLFGRGARKGSFKQFSSTVGVPSGVDAHEVSSEAHREQHEREAQVDARREKRRHEEERSSNQGPFLD